MPVLRSEVKWHKPFLVTEVRVQPRRQQPRHLRRRVMKLGPAVAPPTLMAFDNDLTIPGQYPTLPGAGPRPILPAGPCSRLP